MFKRSAKPVLAPQLIAVISFSGLLMAAQDDGKAPARSTRAPYLYEAAADRKLTPEQRERISVLGDLLIDKSKDFMKREDAARELGLELAHQYCIPPLLAVIRDRNENRGTRQKCVIALSQISDKRVIDLLIEALSEDEGNVVYQAARQLTGLTRQSFVVEPSAPREVRQREMIDKWREWWARNRQTYEVDRTRALLQQ